ncbi:unnamed protein product [Acanthoscelides obtectus]|uniref:Uncharacterized protein n=1 Tax=Acanthoscelides obtectus TaxID=200917 RepID=A0A9P0MM13_ACAOB|nr:unnamed protein product [Acanthoscelides obtectus]CAK1658906.1 hypothetical protein AOBTE_LOCUS21192 [Acanthoscelides obtectus]
MRHKLAVLTFSALVAVSTAGIIPTIEVLQGPGSKTILHGPDGSALKAANPGGTVVTEDHGTGLVAAGPAVLPAAGPALVVHGPAGWVESSYTLAGPAVVPGVAPAITGGIGGAAIAPGAKSLLIAGEGEYGHDNIEALYDDGSYREH